MAAIMSRTAIRHFIARLLILLLPLHAAVAAPLAVCAAMVPPAQAKAAMPDCEQMAEMAGSQSSAPDQTMKFDHHPTGGCWLGSICLASLSAFALPMQSVSGESPRSKPMYAAPASHYRSIILDAPPRPPTSL